ncbi:MAG: TlyA family RNA methyltransferase [Tissierellaceae bacterium]|nr:TlyA family RNA methyltransferase [Tissierellaceae bacterium]
MKKRADIVLYEKGLVDSREKAKRIIMEGSVFIGSERVSKPGENIDEESDIYIKDNPIKYVSRGGHKLEKAINDFGLNLENAIAMDIGSSTGGFTDCMLKEKASKVYAVDVGYGQLDWALRQDSRVVVMERTNIRNITKDDIDDELDFISIDVSFISLKLVLPVAKSLMKDKAELVALIKPQFEAGKDKVGKNGIVREKETHIEVINSIVEFLSEIGLNPKNLSFSPITGAKGNIEFLVHAVNNGETIVEQQMINNVVEYAHETLK